jgi:integrase
MDILKEAADALQEHDKRRQAFRESDEVLRALCRRWGEAAGLWGVSPTHLRRACEARGLLNEGVNNEPAV